MEKIIPVEVWYRQKNDYGCTVVITRILIKHFTGKEITQREAEELIKCNHDGALFEDIRRGLRKYEIKSKVLGNIITKNRKKVWEITGEMLFDAIDKNRLIVFDDDNQHTVVSKNDSAHAMLMIGYMNNKDAMVIEPNDGMVVMSLTKILKGVSEAFLVWG